MENGVFLEFNNNKYRKALLQGNFKHQGTFVPFINVDPLKYEKLRTITKPLDLSMLKNRFGENLFNKVRGAVALSLRYSRMFFPAYRFLINEILNDDWLAAVNGSSYHRDHVMHHPMSAYVGLSLLEGYDFSQKKRGGSNLGVQTIKGKVEETEIKFNGNTLLEHCVNVMKSPKCNYLKNYYQKIGGNPRIFEDDSINFKLLRKWLFLDTFFLAALFHDIGYPWNFVTKVHDKLKAHSPIENPITRNSEWIANHYGDRLVLYPLRGYKERDITAPFSWPNNFFKLVDDTIAKTHGLHGAIALLHLNDLLRKYPLDDYDEPSRRFCIEWAAMAVMMHDMAGIYASINDDGVLKQENPHLRLSLSRDPLSFMLTLTDQIQEFDRPDASFRCHGDKSSIVTYGSRCSNVQVRWDEDNGLFEIIYEYQKKSDYLINKHKYLPERQIHYFDPVEGYLDFSDIGIRQVKLEAVHISKKNNNEAT